MLQLVFLPKVLVLSENYVPSDVIAALQQHLADEKIPLAVRDNVEQHLRDIVDLANDLAQLGVAQNEIDHHISGIVQRYESILALKTDHIQQI